jgi:hypothetical protein
VFDFTPGTVVLDVTDPSNDHNGSEPDLWQLTRRAVSRRVCPHARGCTRGHVDRRVIPAAELPDRTCWSLEPADRGAGLRPALRGCAWRHPRHGQYHRQPGSRFITFSVPATTLGHPASGWAFTVVLSGQDGFSPDQARSFAPTPQPFQFGVCAAPSADAHCTFDPNRVPKAVDVLTPTGVSQADELDYTLHNPVVIQPVTIP